MHAGAGDRLCSLHHNSCSSQHGNPCVAVVVVTGCCQVNTSDQSFCLSGLQCSSLSLATTSSPNEDAAKPPIPRTPRGSFSALRQSMSAFTTKRSKGKRPSPQKGPNTHALSPTKTKPTKVASKPPVRREASSFLIIAFRSLLIWCQEILFRLHCQFSVAKMKTGKAKCAKSAICFPPIADMDWASYCITQTGMM